MSPPPTPHDAPPHASPVTPVTPVTPVASPTPAPTRRVRAPLSPDARARRGAWAAFAVWAVVLGVVIARHGNEQNGVVEYFAFALLAALLAGAVLASRRGATVETAAGGGGGGHSHRPGSPGAIVGGLQNTFALSLAFFFFVNNGFAGQHIEQAWFDFIRPLVRASFVTDTPPVVVVDMTDVPRVAVDGADEDDRITDRRPLRKFLETVARESDPTRPPVAVGIDVNFRDPNGGFVAPDDGAFFRACLAIEDGFNNGGAAEGKPFRVFLGVAQGADLPRDVWLGSPRYAPLAASIDVPTSDARALYSVLWRGDRAETGLFTMGAATATAYAPGWRARPAPPLTTQEAEVAIESATENAQRGGVGEPDLKAQAVLVDYRWLNTLRATSVPLKAFERDPRRIRELAGKVVLIGDVKGATVDDAFFVPGEPRPVPGIFLHACMASTLIAAPLYQIKPLARTLLDLGISFAILFGLAALDRQAQVRNRFLQPYIVTGALAFAGGGVFLVSLLLAYQRIIWADAALIVFALMLDRPVDRLCYSLSSLVRRAERAAFTDAPPPTAEPIPTPRDDARPAPPSPNGAGEPPAASVTAEPVAAVVTTLPVAVETKVLRP